jgi:hypothetical protein
LPRVFRMPCGCRAGCATLLRRQTHVLPGGSAGSGVKDIVLDSQPTKTEQITVNLTGEAHDAA